MVETTKPRTLAAEMAAEFAGTFILLLFGIGVVLFSQKRLRSG